MPTAKARLPIPFFVLAAAFAALAAPAPAAARGACNFGGMKPDEITDKQARASINCLVSQHRNKRNKSGLSSDKRLVRAADGHSGVMANKTCLSHQCSGEPDLAGRLRNVGYLHDGLSRWSYGENVAKGTGRRGTPRQIMKSFMRSSAHRSAILSGTYKDLGVGFQNRGNTGYYTIDFGMRRG